MRVYSWPIIKPFLALQWSALTAPTLRRGIALMNHAAKPALSSVNQNEFFDFGEKPI
jgi:hypothetical protein